MLTILTLLAASAATPDVQLSWTEPTCEDAALHDAAATRVDSVCGAAGVASFTYQYRTSKVVAGCEMWVHAWCDDAPSVRYQAPGSVDLPTVYSDKNHRGMALALGPGVHPLRNIPMRDGGDWNDKAGSVRVPAGWSIRLCHEPGGAGRCTDFVSDSSDLGTAYVGNDTATWAEVVEGAPTVAGGCPRLFEHDGFGGKYLEVCTDQPDLSGSFWNDRISSAVVPSGWALEIAPTPTGARRARS